MTDFEETQTTESLIAAVERALKCSICQEDDQELRILTCCGKFSCLPCIKKEFVGDDERELHERTSVCPFCQKAPAENCENRPVSKIAQHFRKWLTDVKNKGSQATCNTDDCTTPVSQLCKCCKSFFCERCSLKGCLATDGEHETTEIADCIAGSKQTFLLWKESKQQELKAMVAKLNEAFATIKEQGLILSKATDDPLAEELRNTFSLLFRAQTKLNEVHEKVIKSKSSFNFVVDSFSCVTDTDLVYMVNQLEVYEKTRKVSVGKFEPIIQSGQFYDVTLTPDGLLIASKDNGINVIDISCIEQPKIIKSIPVEGHVFSLMMHGSNIVASVVSGNGTEVITFDHAYQELCRWKANISHCDFTIVNDKLIFSSQRPSNLKVYSMTGSELSSIAWNGSSSGLVKMSSMSIAIADEKYNKVYKKQICTDDILWSAVVEKPFSMCVDIDQNIWIRSNDKDRITIVSPQGKKVQEITDANFTKLGKWMGIMVHSRYLYACHENGVGRFELVYDA